MNLHYSSILKACADTRKFSFGKQIHNEIIERKLNNSIILQNGLIYFYAKCGDIEKSKNIFENMKEKDVYSWNYNDFIICNAWNGKRCNSNI